MLPLALRTILLAILPATSISHAASLPEIAVVGLHFSGQDEEQARKTAAALVDTLAESGKLAPLSPDGVAARIRGREELILNEAFLGPGKELLNKARVLYDRALPDQAIPLLDRAVSSLESSMPSTTDSRILMDTLILKALCHQAMGETDLAKESFGMVVTMDPALQLNPINYSPSIIDLFLQVHSEVMGRGLGAIEITTATPGATVFLDGRRVGESPTTVTGLPAGPHFCLVFNEDGYRSHGTIDVEPGARTTFKAELTERIVTEPADSVRGRSQQTRDLYTSLGEHVQADLVLLGGAVEDGQLGLQLYATRTNTFSKSMTTVIEGDPLAIAQDLMPVLVNFTTSTGDIRSDRVSAKVLPLYADSNPVLAELLLNQNKSGLLVADENNGSRWYLWTGAALVAAIGATAATLALTSEAPVNSGTIIFNMP